MSEIFSRGSSPSYAQSLLDRINYHKTLTSSENAIKNLHHINHKLNDNNIFALAYLSANEAISAEERKLFEECVKAKAMQRYEIYSREIEKKGTNGSL
jgi:hypothetical protein